MSEWLASGYICSKLRLYSEGLASDPSFVNQTTGCPLGGKGTGAVCLGGPIVNRAVYYYELNKIAPVVWVGVPGAVGPGQPWAQWYLADGRAINETAIYTSKTLDMFVIEVFVDLGGRYVFIAYGVGWRGTYAAGKYFDSVIFPKLEEFNYRWIIVKWEDTNKNGFVDKPGDGDTYTPLVGERVDERVVRIGVISPTTSGLEDIKSMYKNIIEPDINNYCSRIKAPYRFEFLLEDAQSQAAIHLEKVKAFKAMKVDLIIGGGWSSQAQASLSYVNENNMLLFSPSSTSPLLAIPGDNLFRMCPNDLIQSRAIAEMLSSWGIKAVIVIQRGDIWGEGIYNSLIEELAAKNITVVGRIVYPTETSDFSSYLAEVESLASQAVQIYGVNRLAVEVISFEDEIVTIAPQAQNYPTIYNLFWFGSDATALSGWLVASAPDQAKKLKVFSTMATPTKSLKYLQMYDRYYQLTNHPLNFYTACYIDIAWVIAQAVLETRSINASDVIRAIPDISSRYFGYTGWCLLDENGDRASSDYDIWGCGDPDGNGIVEWVLYGYYNSVTGKITWYEDLLASEGITIPGP
ncbi:MAG: ABC transporter substrate-binding protein [Candidatus Bathyarchaeia archaeon]